jgi:hypothetical protein
MNGIRGGRVTCYLYDIRPLGSFGQRQVCRTRPPEPSAASKTTRTLRSRISILIAARTQARLRSKSSQTGCPSKPQTIWQAVPSAAVSH